MNNRWATIKCAIVGYVQTVVRWMWSLHATFGDYNMCYIYMIVHRITFVFLQYVLKNMEKNKRRKGYKLARRFEEAHFDFGIGWCFRPFWMETPTDMIQNRRQDPKCSKAYQSLSFLKTKQKQNKTPKFSTVRTGKRMFPFRSLLLFNLS